MKRQQKMGVLSALVILTMSSFGMSQMAQAEYYSGSDTITISSNNEISVKNMAVGNETEEAKAPVAEGEDALAIGVDSSAKGDNTVAVGTNNTAGANQAVAMGRGNTANGQSSTAVGVSNEVTEGSDHSSAVGYYNNITGERSNGMGHWNFVTGSDSSGIGSQNVVTGDYSVAVGFNNIWQSTSDQSVAIGAENEIWKSGAAAVGYYNTNYGLNSATIGNSNTTMGEASSAMGYANYALSDKTSAVGYSNYVSGEAASGFGAGNTVTGDNAMAFGNGNIVTAEKGMAFGYKSYVGASGAVAIGNEAVNTEAGTVSFGHKKGDFTGLYVNGDGKYSTTPKDGFTAVNYDSDQFARLTNVAAGEDTHDAATYGQLIGKASYDAATGVLTFTKNDSTLEAITVTIPSSAADVGDTKKLSAAGLGDNVVDSVLSVNDRVDTLSDDINKVGAGAAALAALHPEGFDPADKWSFAVGYGHYKSANAGALGAFYKPNFDTTLSVGGTIGNGNSMLNAGVSFKLGQRGARLSQNASNQQLVQEMQSLRMNNDRLLAQNEEQQKEISAQAQEIRELKAQMARVLAKLGE